MKRRHASFAGKVALQANKILIQRKTPEEMCKKQLENNDATLKKSLESTFKSQAIAPKSLEAESSQKVNNNGNQSSSEMKSEDNKSSSHNYLISSSPTQKMQPKNQLKSQTKKNQNSKADQEKSKTISSMLKCLTTKLAAEPVKNSEQQKKNTVKIYSQDEQLGSSESQSEDDQKQDDKKHENVGFRKIKANAFYRPKNFSQPWNILKALYLLEAHLQPITLEQVQQKYKTIKESPLRHFHHHKQRLEVNNYIKMQGENQIKLLERGQKFIAPRINLIQPPKMGNTNHSNKEKTSKSIETQNKKSHQNHTLQNKQKNSQDKPKYKYFSGQQETYPKQILNTTKKPQKIKLLINQNATSMMQSRLCDFTAQLQEDGGIRYVLGRLHTNIHFFWEFDNNILDCFVVLIKGLKTDLEFIKSALSDGKYCSTVKLIIIAELNFEKQRKNERRFHKDEEYFQKVKQQMEKFLFDSRAAGFGVFQTINQEQTIAFLKKLTSLLCKKIKHASQTGDPINHYGSIEKLNQWFKRSKVYNQCRINIKCLKRIKGFSAQSLRRLAQKLPTLANIYSKMQKLDENEERVRFLKWLLQDYHPNTQANTTLVELLFLEDYNKQKKPKAIKNEKKISQEEYKSNDSYIA